MGFRLNASSVLGLLLIIGIFVSGERSMAAASQTTWSSVSSVGEIHQRLTQASRPGLLYFASRSCLPCQQLEAEFKEDPLRSFIQEQFVLMEIQEHTLFAHYHVQAVPTIVLIDSTGAIMDRIIGYSGNPTHYRARLQSSLAGENLQAEAARYLAAESLRIRAALDYADALFQKQIYDEALPLYRQYVDSVQSPQTRARLYFNMSKCYFHTHQLAQGVRLVERGFQDSLFTAPRSYYLQGILGRHYFQQRQFRQAIRWFELLPMTPAFGEQIHWRLATERDRILEALAYYFLGEDSLGQATIDTLCAHLMQQGRYRLFASYTNAILIYEQGMDAIIPWVTRAVEAVTPVDSGYAGVFEAAGELYARQGKPTLALAMIKQALHRIGTDPRVRMSSRQMHRDSVNALATLGMLHRLMGDTVQAAQCLRQVYTLARTECDARWSMARAVWNTRMDPGTCREWANQMVDCYDPTARRNVMQCGLAARLYYRGNEIARAVALLEEICSNSTYHLYHWQLAEYREVLQHPRGNQSSPPGEIRF